MDMSGILQSLPEFEEPPKKVCAVCQAPADKSCGACHQLHYCCAEHQKSDWNVHKKDCPPIKIVTTPELGPHYVAIRDIPPWTLLLTELPVLVNPLVIKRGQPLSCISCRSIIPGDPWPCFECSTPYFCNLSCSINKVHSEFECGILSKCSEEQRERLCMQPNLLFLRAINLKNKDPQIWTKVLTLFGNDQYTLEDSNENDMWFIREILPLLGEQGVGFEEDIAKLRGIQGPNWIVVLSDRKSPNESQGESQLLYLKANNFAQNCFPNCSLIIGKAPQFQLQIRTSVRLKKGEIPSIDYIEESFILGVMVRQHLMRNLRGLLCICPRCSDPTGTELGTMLSAVKCTHRYCKNGYLLPSDTMNLSEDAPWRCNRAGCKGRGSTWAEIEELNSKYMSDILSFFKSTPVTDLVRIKEFWESLKKKFHPNHNLVLEFERGCVNKLNTQMIERRMRFSLPRMDLHNSMIEHLVEMITIMVPGLGRIRARLMTKLFNGLHHKLLWYKEDYPRAEQRLLMKRELEVVDQLVPIAKIHSDIWTPPNFEYLLDRQRKLEMAMNSTN